MIDKEDIRRLVLESLTHGHVSQFNNVCNAVEKKVVEENLSPGNLKEFRKMVDEVLWDLIIERFVTFGSEDGNAEAKHPFIRMTDIGKQALEDSGYHLYDPERYVTFVQQNVSEIDDITKQYALEAVRCFRHGLLFAAAVMIGAAAEKELLGLLNTIVILETDPKRKQKGLQILERGRLPALFNYIEESLKRAKIPYSIQEGSITHLMSFQEMIRVQRNESVHPSSGSVSRSSVYLSLQTFPYALAVLERIQRWFDSDKTDDQVKH